LIEHRGTVEQPQPGHFEQPRRSESSGSSVIVFGAVRIIDDRTMKAWFFDRLLAKYDEEGRL
jgi:hypothetical protein